MNRVFFAGASLRARTVLPLSSIRYYANKPDYDVKYAEKLQQRAKAKGVGLEELKLQVKKAALEEVCHRRERVPPQDERWARASRPAPSAAQKERKDSPPIKPLSNILNIPRIMSAPHTPAQISALWNAYHMSRSNGTGRGFVCASMPLDTYQKMMGIATKYPTFVVPIPRPRSDAESLVDAQGEPAYEFYYLQWDFHGAPPPAAVTDELFAAPKPSTTSDNPQTSTVLFTPLQEYKSRLAFATPYLVLTHYTDLAQTHGIILLRGEITPNANSAALDPDTRYLLSQSDAQLLSVAVQKFYLWNDDDNTRNEGGKLLQQFHEEPTQFKWEELLKQGSLGL
ncbi:hypothetical protein AX17_000478 [Amanita inopinata Kibby_2008]|nr:hypothetical protein AX17_000478 [Amanita inopinata Kibby_2008]